MWENVRSEINRRRLEEWEAEEQRRLKAALHEAVEISERKLQARRAHFDSEDITEAELDDDDELEDDDEDEDDEDDSRGSAMSGTDDDDSGDGADDESNMSSSEDEPSITDFEERESVGGWYPNSIRQTFQLIFVAMLLFSAATGS